LVWRIIRRKMMAASNSVDKFANMALITTVESAPNTLTFKKLETGISMTEKVAWVISRVEYIMGCFKASQFAQDGDQVEYGLSLSNAWATPQVVETTIIDYNLVTLGLWSSVGVKLTREPHEKSFASMPSGGIIVPPTPFYAWVKGTALTSAVTLSCRIWYTLLPLAIDQYWELVESRRVLSS
jgi:hypothetical protein